MSIDSKATLLDDATWFAGLHTSAEHRIKYVSRRALTMVMLMEPLRVSGKFMAIKKRQASLIHNFISNNMVARIEIIINEFSREPEYTMTNTNRIDHLDFICK